MYANTLIVSSTVHKYGTGAPLWEMCEGTGLPKGISGGPLQLEQSSHVGHIVKQGTDGAQQEGLLRQALYWQTKYLVQFPTCGKHGEYL